MSCSVICNTSAERFPTQSVHISSTIGKFSEPCDSNCSFIFATNTSVASTSQNSRSSRQSTSSGGFSLWSLLKWTVLMLTTGIIAAALIGVIVGSLIYRRLPPVDLLQDYRPSVPLRVWSADGKLIGEFGEERRDFIHLKDVPDHVKKAILAAEDDGFYEHPGIEISGIVRAALTNLLSGRRSQGGSTITQQVARNFFLSSERTYTRKIYEIAMSFKIEHTLTKDEILEIYMNQIYLGQRAYGFQSAAKTYFGRPLDKISVGEAATLAGLPVAPSAYNPIVNPSRAQMRKNYVLRRMYELGYIDELTYQSEKAAPIVTRRTPTAEELLSDPNADNPNRVAAHYAAELARMLVYDIFKDETYSRGINVYTTINSEEQMAAVEAVRRNLIAYDRKYGYRGPEGFVDISNPETRAKAIKTALSKTASSPFMVPGVVLEAAPNAIRVALSATNDVALDADSLKFGRRYLGKNAQKNPIVPGSIVRVMKNTKTGDWTLAQVPQVETAFVAADFNTGAVKALVGGFDFNLNMFNHVTQAWRQPGSSFKPFIYSAALEKGFTPATIVNDAPFMIDPKLTGNKLWEPHNYDKRYDGPMPLRTALEKSKNLVSVRVLQAITPLYAQQYIQKFGFTADKHPAVLPMALGAGSVTPWQMMGAYAVFANGGYRVQPYLIERVTDVDGRTLMRATNRTAGDEAIRVISDRNAYTMFSLLHGVAVRGTAARATRELKRQDLAGKTGTSNDAHDAWFCGFGGNLVGVAWMGYDTPKPLGSRETGGGLALPIWIEFMRNALQGQSEYTRLRPDSIVEQGGEIFYKDPVGGAPITTYDDGQSTFDKSTHEIIRDQIF